MKIGKLEVVPDEIEVKNWSKFSFKPMNEKHAYETMERGCDILAKTGVNYWLSSGNLLGLYRDGMLIPHDTDIDVNVSMKWDSLQSNIVSKQIVLGLTNNKFRIIRTIIYKNNFMQLATIDENNDIIFDVCFFYTGIEKGQATHLNMLGYINKPLRFISKPRRVLYKGNEYPIPAHTEEFLTWRFGDWKTPKTEKTAWENESPNFHRYI